jgi:hypothetical protein
MPDIPYDASRDALDSPQLRPTVLTAGKQYDVLALSVEFARLAYVGFERSDAERTRLEEALGRVQFDGFVPFNDPATGTQGFGALRSHDGLAILAFRGTEPQAFTDLGTDLEVTLTDWNESGGRVHEGFARAARSIFEPVTQWLQLTQTDRKQLILTGRSLGAAIATLYASVLESARLITIGSPRVGDAAFVATLDKIDVTRYVDCCDVVTELPPELAGYEHVGTASYLTRAGQLAPSVDAAFIDADRSAARAEYLREYAWKTGNVVLRDLADHAPINYVRCLVP